jgi:hypothetical protein
MTRAQVAVASRAQAALISGPLLPSGVPESAPGHCPPAPDGPAAEPATPVAPLPDAPPLPLPDVPAPVPPVGVALLPDVPPSFAVCPVCDARSEAPQAATASQQKESVLRTRKERGTPSSHARDVPGAICANRRPSAAGRAGGEALIRLQ